MKFRRALIVTALAVAFTHAMTAVAIDLSAYDLTPKQRELILRLEARGISEKTLLDFAAALVREKHAVKAYIPDHTLNDLFALTNWAVGGAYFYFAKNAGVQFDRAAYLKDCPHPRLFAYARITGSSGLRLDVMTQYNNTEYMLSDAFQKDPDHFQETYLNFIVDTSFARYILHADGTPMFPRAQDHR